MPGARMVAAQRIHRLGVDLLKAEYFAPPCDNLLTIHCAVCYRNPFESSAVPTGRQGNSSILSPSGSSAAFQLHQPSVP